MASIQGTCCLICGHCFPSPRGPPRSSSSDPDFVVVDGVPVMLPSYDEAVNGGMRASGPGYLASVGQACPLPVDDQSPPAYPGSGDMDMGTGGSEACDSGSASSELLQSLYSPSVCLGGTHPDSVDTGAGTTGETASSSPGIDIADGECWPCTRRQASLQPEPLLVALSVCVLAIQSGRAAGANSWFHSLHENQDASFPVPALDRALGVLRDGHHAHEQGLGMYSRAAPEKPYTGGALSAGGS